MVSPVYGAMDMEARKNSVGRFRANKSSVLIVTDVAARGIDIPLLECAVNYDFPPRPKLFVHRVGRVARAGRAGTAYSLLTRDELGYLLDLHLFLGRRLEAAPLQPASLDSAQACLRALAAVAVTKPARTPSLLAASHIWPACPAPRSELRVTWLCAGGG